MSTENIAEPAKKTKKRVSSDVAHARRLRRLRDKATRLVPHEPLMRMARRMLAYEGPLSKTRGRRSMTHGAFRLFREFFERQSHDLLSRAHTVAKAEGRKRIDRKHVATVAEVLGLMVLHAPVIDAMINEEEETVKMEE